MLAVGSAVRWLWFRLRSTRVKYRADVPNYGKSTDMPVIALVEFVWTLGRLTPFSDVCRQDDILFT